MRPFSLSLLPLSLALTGCALSTVEPTTQDQAVPAIHGKVFGGQQAVASASVQLWVAGTSTTTYAAPATALGTPVLTSTDGSGSFTYGNFTCPSASAPTYITARGGNAGYSTNANILEAAALGPCGQVAAINYLTINEVTTAATAFALSHFFTTNLSTGSDSFGGQATATEGYNPGLVLAGQYTVPLLVNLANGTANTSTTSATLTTTFESAKLYTLANILAACVNSSGGAAGSATSCGTLFTNTTVNGVAPTDTLQAAVQIALYPYKNVANLYSLPTATNPFVGLAAQPTDWTLAVSYTSSAFGLGISGSTGIQNTSSTIDIDAAGNVWFPTNSSASHGIGEFLPTTSSFAGPYATTLVRPQYVALDNNNTVWATDLAVAHIAAVPAANPSATASVALATAAVTGPLSAGYNNNSAVVGMNFVANSTTVYSEYNVGTVPTVSTTSSGPLGSTGIASFSQPVTGLVGIEADDLATRSQAATSTSAADCYIESNGPGTDSIIAAAALTNCSTGGIVQVNNTSFVSVASSANALCNTYNLGCTTPTLALNKPQGIAIDGQGNLWVANSGNASVSTYLYNNGVAATSTVQYLHNATNGNTIQKPYGLAIDRSGNVWLSNAGCTTTSTTPCAPGAFTLSELVGAAAPTITPIAAQLINRTYATRPAAIQTPIARP